MDLLNRIRGKHEITPEKVINEVEKAFRILSESEPLIAGIIIFGSSIKNDGGDFRKEPLSQGGSDIDIMLIYNDVDTEDMREHRKFFEKRNRLGMRLKTLLPDYISDRFELPEAWSHQVRLGNKDSVIERLKRDECVVIAKPEYNSKIEAMFINT